MAHPLRNRRVHGVLCNVPLDPKVICARPLIFLQRPALHLILACCLPRAQHHLADTPHRLRVAGHHRYRTQIVEHIFCGDSFGPDTRLGEGHVFGDILRQVVAHHQHVEMLVKGIAGEWSSGIGG